MNSLLPLGSVVLLKEGKKRVMIYGRKQIQVATMNMYDYIACLYPEGNINGDYTYLFNHESIAKVYFIGFQDEEELEFHEKLKCIDKNDVCL